MTLFADASALVAIMAGEPERDQFIDAVADGGDVIWSPLSCWEAVSSLRRIRELAPAAARREVEQTAKDLELRLVSIGEAELRLALDAYERYGRNAAHPAKLNFGDCFAYACAKANRAKLLYKGDDFSHTDLA